MQIIVWMLITLALSIANLSGWGEAKDTWSITAILFITAAFLTIINRRLIRSTVSEWDAVAFAFLIFAFVIVPMVDGFKPHDGLNYIVAFLIVFVFRTRRITLKYWHTGAALCAISGLIFLSIYLYGHKLDGWNDNTVAMEALMCYLVYYPILFQHAKPKAHLINTILVALYTWLLFQTDSRTSQIVMVASFIPMICTRMLKRIFRHRSLLFIYLQIPLIIAVIVLLTYHSNTLQHLDQISNQLYEKTMLSGREDIWVLSLYELWEQCFRGLYIFMRNYHNSAVACLNVFGALGYASWIFVLLRLIRPLRLHIGRPFAYGTMMSFLLIYLHQSMELGLIVVHPNPLPYMILGIGIALAKHVHARNKHYNTSLQYRRAS